MFSQDCSNGQHQAFALSSHRSSAMSSHRSSCHSHFLLSFRSSVIYTFITLTPGPGTWFSHDDPRSLYSWVNRYFMMGFENSLFYRRFHAWQTLCSQTMEPETFNINIQSLFRHCMGLEPVGQRSCTLKRRSGRGQCRPWIHAPYRYRVRPMPVQSRTLLRYSFHLEARLSEGT
ncbi:hypothetical protein CC78DRAFT_277030 [Lojkania enalia]|uniref:Uncharacterized protein n=1 Tax=Lojkania enalia TaxID=147567 RepID=A0A9P4TQ98_9PLEO|nr:hypothetical protein CC78DRAFT_277030 [Didymosphaeria enalia]